MKNARTTLLVIALLLVSVLLVAQEKYSQVKVYAMDKAQRSDIIGLLEIDHFVIAEDGALVSEISARQLKQLMVSGIKYKVLIDDVAKNLEIENQKYYDAVKAGLDPNAGDRVAFDQVGNTVGNIIATPAAFTVQPTFGGYYSFAQMNTAMNNLVAAYPTLASKTSLGLTVGGRDIWCIKISDNVAVDEANEPEVLFIGVQHAREAITGSSMIFLMQYLCEQYAADTRIKNLVDNREIYIIPCLNPDGWEYNRSTNPNGGGGWRKNRRNNGGGQFGVDLNRNWGVDWANCSAPILGNPASCGSGSTSSDTYYGPSVFSENETQAVRNFVYTRNFVACIDQHAYGPYYSLPFGRPSLHPGVDSLDLMEQQYYVHLSSLMGTYNGMRAGNSYQSVGYEVAGGVKDWMLKGNIGTGSKGRVFGFTGEGGAGGGTGGTYGNFWAPAAQIVNLCKGMTYQNLQLLYTAGPYVDIQDMSDLNVSSKTGTFDFKITRVGIADGPVTISLVPISNVMWAGTPVTVPNLPNFYDTYSGSISYTLNPNLPDEQRLRFAWKIETGGSTYYDTVTKFYNPQSLLYDDMEGTFSSTWTSTGGWAYTTDDAYQGSRSLNESPGGDYPASTTRTLTYNSTFNLSNATTAMLSFRTKHRAENFRDKLQVQVSTNGAVWTAIAGSTTVQEPGTLDGSTLNGQPALTGIRPLWTQELFDLGAFIGAANLRLRFVFSSDANNTGFVDQVDDGFFIDNLQVVKSTVPQVTLPVSFLSFTGKLLPNKTVQLDWEASTDPQHDYFEVERSADGTNFKPLGKVYAQPFQFIDNIPYTGNNYYRLKQYDKDGKYSYSKVINVVNNPRLKVSVYPNPLPADETVLTVRLQGAVNETLQVTIRDAQGRKVYEKAVKTLPASGELKINTASWSPNVYVLKATDKGGELLTIQKIIKK